MFSSIPVTFRYSHCKNSKKPSGNDVGRIEKEYDIPLEEDLRKNFSRIRRQNGYGSFYKLLLTRVERIKNGHTLTKKLEVCHETQKLYG